MHFILLVWSRAYSFIDRLWPIVSRSLTAHTLSSLSRLKFENIVAKNSLKATKNKMKIVSFFWWIDICSNLFFYPENQHDTAPKINRIVASQKLYYFGTFKSIMLLYPLCYNNWLKISYLTFCFCAISGWFSGLEKKFEQISIHQKNETIFILFLLAFREFFFLSVDGQGYTTI